MVRAVSIIILALMTQTAHAEIIIRNTASVTGSTKASANTGGNDVDSGGSVTTGEASASATSHVRAEGGSGTIDVRTESSANGSTTIETRTETLVPGEPIEVRAGASARAQPATTVSTDDAVDSDAEVKAETSAEAEVDVIMELSKPALSVRIRSFFERIFAGLTLLAWWR